MRDLLKPTIVFVAVAMSTAIFAVGQAPQGGAPAGRGTPPPQGRGAGGLSAGPDDRHVVDPAAADRGKKTYTAECSSCHGPQARGTATGSNLVRSLIVLRDRNGKAIGPFLKKGHPTQSGIQSATLTQAQIEDLAHFIHQRVDDTLRGSPIFEPQDVLTGDAKAGEAYFNDEGRCTTCHSATGDLAGIGKRYDPVNLQQRFVFPRGRGGRGRGGPPAKPVTVTVTPPSGQPVSGVLMVLDDFTVALRDGSGEYRSWRRTPDVKVVKNDPYAAHIELLDTLTDKAMHDVVAYLATLK